MQAMLPDGFPFSQFYLRYDLPNGFTDLQQGRDFTNLFLFKYMPF